jgi:hypothetical protein
MNKLTLNKGKAIAYLILMCLFLVQSCRRDTLIPNSNDRIENARIWYGKKFDKSTSSLVSKGGKYSFPLTVKPKWDAAQFSEVEGQAEAYIIPLDINVPLELRQSVDPILIMRKNDSGYEAKLIGDEESKQSTNNEGRTYNAKSLYQRAFGNNGELTQSNNSVRSNKPTINNTESSKSESRGLSPNKIMATELPPPDVDCIDWYIVTRDRDGNVIDEEFQGRTCGIDQMPGGGGGGGSNDNGTKPVDFGIDPKCLNCKIAISNFDNFLNYLKSLNFQLTQPFGTTVQIGNLFYHGTMVEIYQEGTSSRVGAFFTPDSSSDMFSVGIYYSLGYRGPDGNGNPPTYEYGLTGFSWPVTYYNGKTNPFPMPPGSVTYTMPITTLTNFIGLNSAETTFLTNNPSTASFLSAYFIGNGINNPETIEYVKWAIGYLTANPDDTRSFIEDNFGSEDLISDSDYESTDLTFDINNNGNVSFVDNNIEYFGFHNQVEPDYPQNHPVSQAIENYSPWIYYAFAGANNTSIKHFHETAKGLAAKDGYSKAIGAIGEGLFVKRLTSVPIFPPARVIIGKYVGTTHIDAYLYRILPSLGNTGFEIAINYTTIDGTPAVNKISHPKGFTFAGQTTTAVAYEVKTYNADKNTDQNLFKAFNEGVKQVRHRANLPGIAAAVLVFDDRAWNKLINSSYGAQVITTMNEITAITNPDGEQIIYLRIEAGLSRDAQKVFYALKDRIKNL